MLITEPTPDNTISPDTKLYSIVQLNTAAFFGGPILGCFFLSRNFKHLHEKAKARYALIIGILTTIAIVALGYFFQLKDFGRLIPFLTAGCLSYFATQYQGSALKTHFVNGGKKGSWFTIIGSILLMILLIMALVLTPYIMILSARSK